MLKIISIALQVVFWIIISWRDIRTQKIPVWPGILFGGAGAAFSAGTGTSVWEVAGGLVMGAVVFALAYVSRQAVGYGDALCVGVIGLWNGISSAVWILMCAFFALLLAAIPLLFLKKVTRKTKVPMAPFLTIGLLLVKVPEIWMAI